MGFFSVISRFSAIWGPLIYSYVSSTTGNPRLSLPGISLFFVIGFFLLRKVDFNSQISEEIEIKIRSANGLGSDRLEVDIDDASLLEKD